MKMIFRPGILLGLTAGFLETLELHAACKTQEFRCPPLNKDIIADIKNNYNGHLFNVSVSAAGDIQKKSGGGYEFQCSRFITLKPIDKDCSAYFSSLGSDPNGSGAYCTNKLLAATVIKPSLQQGGQGYTEPGSMINPSSGEIHLLESNIAILDLGSFLPTNCKIDFWNNPDGIVSCSTCTQIKNPKTSYGLPVVEVGDVKSDEGDQEVEQVRD
jgi:hypothetical protein